MKLKPTPRHRTVAQAEEAAWIEFYEGVQDPALAAQLIQHFNTSADLQKSHAALHLKAKRSLQLAKAREERNQRIGHFVRALFGALFNAVLIGRRAAADARDIAVECLPAPPVAMPQEPAVKRVRRMVAKGSVVPAKPGLFPETEKSSAEGAVKAA